MQKQMMAYANRALRSFCPGVGIIGRPCHWFEPADAAAAPAGGRPAAAAVPAAVSRAEVERAIREIDLPPLSVVVQPADSTLVNLATNLYTEAPAIERSVDLLGVAVELHASPSHFTWHHGDGTSQSTTSPGTPYPELTVTHRYRAAGSVELRVDVSYDVEYAIAGGAWTALPEPIVASGPGTALTVRAAAPVLVDP